MYENGSKNCFSSLNICAKDIFKNIIIKNPTFQAVPSWQQKFKQDFGEHCTFSFLMELSVHEKDIWHSDVPLEAGPNNSQRRTEVQLEKSFYG